MLNANIHLIEKYDYLEEKFRKAYQWLRENDANRLEPGSYPIDGDDVYASVQAYETQPSSQRNFESHEKFFDVQYLASGIEKFGVTSVEGLKEKERYPERDLIFYENPDQAGWIVLHPGDAIVVAPEDAHCPMCMAGDAPTAVRKVVVKVRV